MNFFIIFIFTNFVAKCSFQHLLGILIFNAVNDCKTLV